MLFLVFLIIFLFIIVSMLFYYIYKVLKDLQNLLYFTFDYVFPDKEFWDSLNHADICTK